MTLVLAAVALAGALFAAAGLDDARTEAATRIFASNVRTPSTVCMGEKRSTMLCLRLSVVAAFTLGAPAVQLAANYLFCSEADVTTVHKRTLTAPQCDQHYQARLERLQADWNRCHAKIGDSESDARYDF
jgi:hypothetical protein